MTSENVAKAGSVKAVEPRLTKAVEAGDRAAVRAAPNLLAEAIERVGVGEFNGLFARGPDADALFAVMEPVLLI